METRNKRVTPYKVFPPGETLKSELEERGISQKDFAETIGMQPSHLKELIKGKRVITIQIAEKLEASLGISAKLWMNLQNNYDYDMGVLNKKSEKKIETDTYATNVLIANTL